MYSRSAPRRRHGAELKAKVLAQCDEPGASISGVAMAHGLNANLVRQWRAGRGVKRAGKVVRLPESRPAPRPADIQALPSVGANPQFVQVAMPGLPRMAADAPPESVAAPPSASRSVMPDPPIHIELRRGALHLTVRWPTSATGDCMAWLRELSLGPLK